MEILFSGEPGFFGALSNERELVNACPAWFKWDNDWSVYVARLLFHGGQTTNWKWKSSNEAERRHQDACFQAILNTYCLSHDEKRAVAGWMLSEMVVRVPEYIPAKKN